MFSRVFGDEVKDAPSWRGQSLIQIGEKTSVRSLEVYPLLQSHLEQEVMEPP